MKGEPGNEPEQCQLNTPRDPPPMLELPLLTLIGNATARLCGKHGDVSALPGQLDVWLLQGSERFASDPDVSHVLIKAAREKDTRRSLLLLGTILETPGLADRRRPRSIEAGPARPSIERRGRFPDGGTRSPRGRQV